jgi:flagellar basal body rod protein FlgG
MTQEMSLLIRSQRAYSLASKALQTADDMEGLANSIH